MERTTTPGFRAPMLATLSDTAPVGEGWTFERKLDGIRLIVVRSGDEVRLWTRNHNDRTASFTGVADAVRAQPAERFVADGEAVAFSDGVLGFGALGSPGTSVVLYLFDLLHLDGRDVDQLPLGQRRRLLADAFDFGGPLQMSDAVTGDGAGLWRAACERGWEGLVAKRSDSAYVGRRSRDWLKLKCVRRQELVIGGWTEPKGSRPGFGALLVGHHDGEDLVYAGRVGTGFDDGALRRIRALLDERPRDTPPFTRGLDGAAPPRRSTHWTEPDLVCEVGFAEWTADGRLRHPRFEGMRSDVDPARVVREEPG